MVTTAASAVRHPRVFYVGVAAALLVLVLAGFAPIYSASVSAGTLPPFLNAHAAVFLFWTVLLLVQASLVARGRVALHRRLGMLGAALLPVMLVLGYMTAVFGARRGHPMWKVPGQSVPEDFPFADSLAFMTVPLGDLVLLAVFGAIAVWYRKRPEIHKRAMLLAGIGCMVAPAASRLPFVNDVLATVLAFVVLLAACRPRPLRARASASAESLGQHRHPGFRARARRAGADGGVALTRGVDDSVVTDGSELAFVFEIAHRARR